MRLVLFCVVFVVHGSVLRFDSFFFSLSLSLCLVSICLCLPVSLSACLSLVSLSIYLPLSLSLSMYSLLLSVYLSVCAFMRACVQCVCGGRGIACVWYLGRI